MHSVFIIICSLLYHYGRLNDIIRMAAVASMRLSHIYHLKLRIVKLTCCKIQRFSASSHCFRRNFGINNAHLTRLARTYIYLMDAAQGGMRLSD